MSFSYFKVYLENILMLFNMLLVQISKYFNSITRNQHRINSITQLKECLK